MNVCRKYNQIMNALEDFESKYVEKSKIERRDNVKEINIFSGLFYIFVYALLLVIFACAVFVLDGCIGGTIRYIVKKTTFKCEVK